MKLIHRDNCGTILPTCIALLGLTAILGVQALRSTQIELALAHSVTEHHQLFSLVERGLALGLHFAANNPTALPSDTQTAIVPDDTTNLAISILPTGHDTECPPFADGERRHFEVQATGQLNDLTRSHRQGFYVCHELCTSPGCIGAITGPHKSYWSYDNS